MRTISCKRTFVFVSALFLLNHTAQACLNDRDSDGLPTEEFETNASLVEKSVTPVRDERPNDLPLPQSIDLPVPLSVITGRFPRHPTLFYEMRIKRVAKEIMAHPERLRLYDDIAVAYDRLGNDDDAIFWINKKRSRLEGTSSADPAFHEDWYRYYANIGTFRAHRWIREGANSRQAAEMRKARAEIARAIEIKPDAHFGREKYQLAIMDWVLDHRSKPLTSYLPTRDAEFDAHSAQNQDEAQAGAVVEGLTGLIVLGGAWESVDVFAALADHLYKIQRIKLGYMAQLRCQELLDGGRKSLQTPGAHGGSAVNYIQMSSPQENEVGSDRKYRELRSEAEVWQNRRWKYMLSRLHQGRHPDTDPKFWKDWKESAAPSLVIQKPRTFTELIENNTGVLIVMAVSALGIVVLFQVRRRL